MKKTDNKGFSLVELIVVIAIMAVLVGVLAPSLLRYVEKSRISSDNTAISEVASAVKTALANEGVLSKVGEGATVTIENGKQPTTTVTELTTEIQKTIGEVSLKSKVYDGKVELNVTVDTAGIVKITTAVYYESADESIATKAF
jgi:type IV pilus assembly protein PilA